MRGRSDSQFALRVIHAVHRSARTPVHELRSMNHLGQVTKGNWELDGMGGRYYFTRLLRPSASSTAS